MEALVDARRSIVAQLRVINLSILNFLTHGGEEAYHQVDKIERAALEDVLFYMDEVGKKTWGDSYIVAATGM